ncbi:MULTISPECIES: DUF2808 domain-containing protein [Nostocales]|uniref:DUF2808 domain-containing protein n=3 Tax=Nostocales TaxID=1161 RepID=A0A0C1MXK2_9CYAN|nr:DUF2808 domain-containing protein [Tolypothrix bouteillei]KAF3889538.1 DUF2808 domain-containing protein [Tolypothrix bouteillei VB521301]
MKIIRNIGSLTYTLIIILGTSLILVPTGKAVQLDDGTVYFNEPPSLGKVETSDNTVNSKDATYFFNVNIPDIADEPLKKINLTQKKGEVNIQFNLKNVVAFQNDNHQQRLSLEQVTYDKKTQTISIIFASPVNPGSSVTIGVQPLQNPSESGTYLFGIEAFPQGNKAHGQFLGFGRLEFFSR